MTKLNCHQHAWVSDILTLIVVLVPSKRLNRISDLLHGEQAIITLLEIIEIYGNH